MSNPNLQKLNELLDGIEALQSEEEVMMKEKLRLEVEKMYAFNALGVCKCKLNNREDAEYKEGLSRTKSFFDKLKEVNF